MVGVLELSRRHVAERFEQALTAVPGDPLERRELDILDTLPRAASIDLLRLEEPVKEWSLRRIRGGSAPRGHPS
jgi:hypothetical protein